MTKTRAMVGQLLMFLFTLCLMLQLVLSSRHNDKDAYRRLHRDIFTNYSKAARPRGKTFTTNVNMVLSPDRIIYLDDKHQSFRMAAFLQFSWYDLDLGWNKSDYRNISQIYRPQSEMWLPPVIYFNSLSGEKDKQLGYERNPVRIYSNGKVEWQMRSSETFVCPIKIRSYPFDVQTCPIEFILKSATTEVLLQTIPDDPVMFVDWFQSGGTWELLEFSCMEKNMTMGDAKFAMVTIQAKMSRRRKHYLLTQILPLAFLSLTATAVFLVPAEAGEKIGVCITVLLAFEAYLTTISDELPRSSFQWCALQVYLMLLYSFTCAAIILTVIVLRIHHISPEVPVGPCLKKFVLVSRRWLCLNFVWKLKWDEDDPSFNRNNEQPLPLPDTANTDNLADSWSLASKRSDTDGDCQTGKSSCATSDTLVRDNSVEDSVVAVVPKPVVPLEARRRRLWYGFLGRRLVTDVTWPRVAEMMDRIIYIIFGISILVLTIVVNLYITLYEHYEVLLPMKDRFPKQCSREETALLGRQV